MADETPEGRSIVLLAEKKYNLQRSALPENAENVSFSAETRLSGVNIDGRQYRKGAADSTIAFVKKLGGSIPKDLHDLVNTIAHAGSTPLVVCRDAEILGVINLKDILKTGIQERFVQLRNMGIKTVMITGDNPLTAAAIAAEAQVDDFLAQARPEDKLKMIRDYQEQGFMVAMTGDGTNDAPALAQADVAVAMNTGTQPAREAANIIDLDSNPTKLLDIVEIGKQILMTRGNLTTFSISNDVAKYFAIIPAALVSLYPQLERLEYHAPCQSLQCHHLGGDIQCRYHSLSYPARAQRHEVSAIAGRKTADLQPSDLWGRRNDCAIYRHQSNRYGCRPAGLQPYVEVVHERSEIGILFSSFS